MARTLVKTIQATQYVSSDTITFVQKFSAINSSTDAVGTFNVYTYALNGNVATLVTNSGTPVSQTTASMNTNGIQVFARAYNAASTATSPTRVDIFIGKGLKNKQIDAYATLAKVNPLSIDKLMDGTGSSGIRTAYNETTGVLTLDCAYQSGNNTGTAFVGVSLLDSTTATSGYFVFNASKPI